MSGCASSDLERDVVVGGCPAGGGRHVARVDRQVAAGGRGPAGSATAVPAGALATRVEEEDVVGDDLGGLALAAVLRGPFAPREAAVDADSPPLGEVVARGLRLA